MNPKSRTEILAEFRGYREPVRRPDRCLPMRDLVGPVMKSLGLADRLDEEEMARCWGELVGPFLASHSKPDRLKEGVLWVRVIQPTLLFELDRVWKSEVLSKLKAKYGSRKIKGIRFRAG